MTKKPSAASKRKQPATFDSHQSIEKQIEAFLSAGGEIEQIPKGVSGQTTTSGPRHITLGKKPRA